MFTRINKAFSFLSPCHFPSSNKEKYKRFIEAFNGKYIKSLTNENLALKIQMNNVEVVFKWAEIDRAFVILLSSESKLILRWLSKMCYALIISLNKKKYKGHVLAETRNIKNN